MMKELVTIEQSKMVDVFKSGGLDPYIEKIREEAHKLVPDVDTDKGRKEIASMAHKIARSKTYLDGLGKDLVSGIKKQAKIIDEERKKMREELDQLKAEVRFPLDEYEAKEKERISAIKKTIDWFSSISEFEYVDSNSAKNAFDSVKKISIDDTFQEFAEQAAKEKDKAMLLLDAKIFSLEKHEEEKAEAARIEREQIEKARKEREERIAKEAADRARREAEEEAKREAERVAEEAKLEADRVERERQRQIDKARRESERLERERQAQIDAAKRAELEAQLALERAEKEKKAAVERERLRIENERKAIEHEEKKRAADRNHRANVNRSAMNALISAGIPEDNAKIVITAIVKGSIPNVYIKY